MVESVVGSVARRIGLGSVVVAATLALSAATAIGQGLPQPRTFKPLNSYTAETLLRRAAEQAKQGQWAEAIDLYQKVIAQHANAVAAVPEGDPVADATGTSELFVDARQHAQARLAALPPEGRALYRSRVDAQAERWYRQGLADRDRAPLRKVIDQLFCSSWGDDALDLLGDMAFQDGQFAEALANYRRILPDVDGPAVAGLTHPDPGVDLARVAAKKLLCREAIGSEPPSAADVKAFADTYPESRGSLAGRDGPLARNLAEALAADHLALPPQSDGRWPTFAGAASRTRIAPGPIDIGQFQWRVKLDPPPPSRNMPPQRAFIGGMGGGSGPSAEIALPFHPIVMGDQVVVCDERRIHAYHLNARPEGGEGAAGSDDPFYWDQPLRGANAPPAAGQSSGGSPRFTLTAFGDRIYARLGPMGKSPSTIVAVRHTGEIEGKRIWEKVSSQVPLPRPRPDTPARYTANFEGTPVADDRNVYVAMSDSANEINAYVACLDAETGALRWIKHLGSAPGNDPNMGGMGMGMGMMPGGGADIGNRLLSLDGQTVYYQTNLGAVAALDCETGAIKWLATYPGRDRNGVGVARESNPAVVHDGLVMVAPDDSVPLLAFDAATGRLVWKTSPAAHTEKVVHLLGVAKGRLIATGDRVYSFSVKDGALLKAWPDGPSGFEAYGRGLLAGDAIYWPTKTDIHVLDAATGDPGDHAPIRLLQHHGQGGGNLAVGDGFLVVAQRDGLVVFAQNSRLIDRFRQEIAKAPDRAASYFQLARVAEATGQDELALANLEETGRRAKPSDTIDGQPLVDEARSKQYKLLVRLADKSSRKADWAEASRRLEAAAKVARNDRDRLSARLRLASAQTKAGDPKAAVVTFQEILGNAKLRAQTVAHDERWTVRADLFIGDELAKILKDGGPELYAEFDREAEALLSRGRREKSARDLEEVGRAFPVARVAGDALWALASLREEENRPADAARAYKRLATIAATDADRVKALLGLARAYQAQGLILPARDTLARVQVKYNDLRLDDPPGGTVGSIVAEKLARPPFDKIGGDRTEPGFSAPLSRLWDRTWDAPVRPIAAEGVPPSPSAVRVFVVDQTAIRPVDPLSGAAPWSYAMEDEPVWAGYLGDRLIAASATRVVALDPLGKVKWRYPEDATKTARPVANPFAPARGAAGDRRDPPIGRLHGFRTVGGRLVFQRGDRELIALDGETGGTDWTFAPPGGGLNSNYCAGPRRVVVQVADPEAMVVLDTETGRRREFVRTAKDKADEPAEPWARPPLLIDDDRVCVDVDPRTVAMLDLTTGKRAWTSRVTSASLPRNGPPRIMGDSSRLLVVYEGNELIRIDPATGRQMWTRSLGLEDLSGSPDAFALDGDRFYCATGGKLSALNLKDGEPIWSRPLIGPDEGWSVSLSERYVAAYPSPGRPNDGPLDGLALVVCRREDGVMVQRLSFPAGVSRLIVRLLPRGAMVATQAGAWALGELKVVDGPPPPR